MIDIDARHDLTALSMQAEGIDTHRIARQYPRAHLAPRCTVTALM
jgi:hypothetical protein